MTVDAVKEAIARLPDNERHSLAAWLNELDYDDWDRQTLADFSPGGRAWHWSRISGAKSLNEKPFHLKKDWSNQELSVTASVCEVRTHDAPLRETHLSGWIRTHYEYERLLKT